MFNLNNIVEDILRRVREVKCERNYVETKLSYLITSKERERKYWHETNPLSAAIAIQENFMFIRDYINFYDCNIPYDPFRETIQFQTAFMIELYSTICEKMLNDVKVDLHKEYYTIKELSRILMRAKQRGIFSHYKLTDIIS